MYNNIALLIGHMVGDYLTQNDWMAVTKSKPGAEGIAACTIHSSIYALCVGGAVCLAGWRSNVADPVVTAIVAFLIAYVCHWPIDRWGLAIKWARLIRQTSINNVAKVDRSGAVTKFNVRAFFWAPVYIAVDNTMHLLLMWIAYSWLGS